MVNPILKYHSIIGCKHIHVMLYKHLRISPWIHPEDVIGDKDLRLGKVVSSTQISRTITQERFQISNEREIMSNDKGTHFLRCTTRRIRKK